MNRDRNSIVLIGAMGSGKSTLGRVLAEKLNYKFLDTDAELVKRTGVSISTIFEIEGEQGFRGRETKLLEDLNGARACVIGTGGGIVLLERNRELLKKLGLVIFLEASEDVLYDRLKNCKDRPLIQAEDRRMVIRGILKERQSLYEDVADIIIKTGMGSVRSMVNKVMKSLKKTKCR